MLCVLDSSAVLAYLMGEKGRDVVAERLKAGPCFIHAINACKALYYLRRDMTPQESEEMLQDLFALGLAVRGDFDCSFLQMIADYKTAPGQVSFADCFGLALAQREGLPFITSDRHELTRVAARGIVAIEFVR